MAPSREYVENYDYCLQHSTHANTANAVRSMVRYTSENMMLSTKLEDIMYLHCYHLTTEPQSQITCTENTGYVAPEICVKTDSCTDKLTPTGGKVTHIRTKQH